VRTGFVRETPGAIRGLFSGGTLRDEALAIVGAVAGAETLLERAEAGAHVLVDLGDERFTEGRPHPMIDPSLRLSVLDEQARDPSVGVLLLDVVLGYGAHPDPAAELAPALGRALDARRGELTAVVSLCGTARDPQGVDSQAERLHAAGAVVTRSNADAAELALAAAGIGSAVS
jgi:FdrA protein